MKLKIGKIQGILEKKSILLNKLKEFSEKLKEFLEKLKEILQKTQEILRKTQGIFKKLTFLPTLSWRLLQKNIQKKSLFNEMPKPEFKKKILLFE